MGNLRDSPYTRQGYLATLATSGALARAIAFQYNPDTVTRSLRPRGATRHNAGPAEAHRLHSAPNETITVTIEFDATDPAGPGRDGVLEVSAQLAALELMLYPTSGSVVARDALLNAGVMEVLPVAAPLTMLVWGLSRCVPVRVESLQVMEQAFDPQLRPVRATVELTLEVLSYDDLPAPDPGRGIFLTYQRALEALTPMVPTGGIEAGALP